MSKPRGRRSGVSPWIELQRNFDPHQAVKIGASAFQSSKLEVDDLRVIIGSANGNRTCIAPVHSSSVRSKYLNLRSVRTRGWSRTPPRIRDVAARWLRRLPDGTSGASQT
jgi:hypothetical protein